MSSIRDLTGKKFGRLSVVSITDRRTKAGGGVYWLCRCDCGVLREVIGASLTRANGTRSCGCTPRKNPQCGQVAQNALDLTGQRFGRLRAVERAGRRGSAALWLCKCECGTESRVSSNALRSGNTQSCGCGRLEAVKRPRVHGYAHRGQYGRTYRIWLCMRTRCNNPRVKRWERWGGRGIKVCKRWDSFENFLEDMGQAPDGLSIDRINNDGNYEPGNCRWADAKTQVDNRACSKKAVAQ